MVQYGDRTRVSCRANVVRAVVAAWGAVLPGGA